MPQPLGMTTPRTAFVAIAASTACPPAREDGQPGRRREVVRRDDGPARAAGQRDGDEGGPEAGVGQRADEGGEPSVAGASPVRMVLVPPQDGQRQDERPPRSSTTESRSDPVEPAPVCGDAADEAAGDLADAEEHGVEAHDRAAVVRIGLGHVGQEPDGGGRRAGEDEQAGAERPRRGERAATERPAERAPWLIDNAGDATRRRRPRPYRMIVVRRRLLKRLPQ